MASKISTQKLAAQVVLDIAGTAVCWVRPTKRAINQGRRPAFRHSSRLPPHSCSLLELLFPYATLRRSANAILEQMP